MSRARPWPQLVLALAGLSGLALCCERGMTTDDAGPEDGATEDGAHPADVGAAASDAPTVEATDAAPPRLTRILVAQDDAALVVLSLDDASGEVAEVGRASLPGASSFVAIDASGTRGAAVLSHAAMVVGLALDAQGVPHEAGPRRASGGAGPTHVSLDRSGRFALVANYGGGTVSTYGLGDDGALTDPLDTATPAPDVSPARAHQIVTSPSSRWALVPCLGADRVVVLSWDPTSGSLAPHGALDTSDGAGPRHLAITTDGAHVLLADELASRVELLALDEASGTLTARESLSTLPPDFSGTNSVAEIALGAGERFAYVSNRGHDSIAIFAIDAAHHLEARGHAMLGARRPRSFAIDPRGRYLLAGAQDDDVLVRFRIEDDGSLTRLGTTGTSGSPTFVGTFTIAGE